MAKNQIKIRGTAMYPKTDQPYSWNEAKGRSVPDPDGKFELRIKVPIEKAGPYMEAIKDVKQGKANKMPFTVDEENGVVIFKTGQKGKNDKGEARKMPHFDSKGKPLPSKFRLTSGSEVVATVHPYQYKAQGGGITLYLDSVQIAKYVEYDGGPGALEDEDGWTYQGSNEDEAAEPVDDLNEDEETTEDEGSTDF